MKDVKGIVSHSATIEAIDVDFDAKAWRKALLVRRHDDEGQTAQELADALDVSARTMNKRLKAGIASGSVIEGRAMRRNSLGGNYPVPVYRLQGAKP